MNNRKGAEDDFQGEESTWPAERVPGWLDAEQANRPIGSSFMQSFKHALLRDQGAGEIIEYLSDSNADLIQALDPSSSNLPYPLMMFSRLPSLPPEHDLQLLVDVFSAHIHPKMALLRYISLKTLLRPDRPRYLTYAMSCLGSIASGGAQSVTESLWWAADILMTATLEVDNREARKADVVNAWVMLEIYGTLSANTAIWNRTNMNHGYVETIARRIFLSYSDDRESERILNGNAHNRILEHMSTPAMPAFVLIDLLRSIHYAIPQTFTRSELLSYSISSNNDYNTIYSNIVLDSRLPPPESGTDGAFLALIALLGDIHTLSIVFHPLVIAEQYESGADGGPKSKSGTTHFKNSYLPFSPENEKHQVNQRLQKALDLWGQSYLGKVNTETTALFHFCRMYISLPSLPLLPDIAGYLPRSLDGHTTATHQTRIVDTDLHGGGSEGLKHAWLILENVRQSEGLTPVWIPIVLFYASLVVWRMIGSQAKSGQNGMHGSLLVLKLFKNELEQMKWPCCEVMVRTLKALMAS